ncbi:hypothetical protein TIFTF001_040641 [Ficus carica]|uniref:Uncharacterized protein n=1 Tax=Ficus carica TaxID=3494 RepID=A0AA87Z450_FICCA|nr:hypothetical protein TIFTF001_040640 [Ficus carica]GMN24934.1 hypothetical protein TIFTF001_040641 [Ficus carica]
MDCIGEKAFHPCSSKHNKQLSTMKFIDNIELTLLTIDRHGWRIRHSRLFFLESATGLKAIVLVNGWHILLVEVLRLFYELRLTTGPPILYPYWNVLSSENTNPTHKFITVLPFQLSFLVKVTALMATVASEKRERREGGVEGDGRMRGRGWLRFGRRSNEEDGRAAAASPGE